MIEIELTKGYIAIIDDSDKDLCEKRWTSVIVRGGNWVYCTGRFNRKPLYMHRVILSRMLGRELTRAEQVDHINGCGTDNRRSNLRLANSVQNHGNTKKHIGSKNPYKGVHPNKSKKNPWTAQVFKGGVATHLGMFNNPEAAHLAYCIAAVAQWGAYANFGANSPFAGMTLEQLQAARS